MITLAARFCPVSIHSPTDPQNPPPADAKTQKAWEETFVTFFKQAPLPNPVFSKNAEKMIAHLCDSKETSGTALDGLSPATSMGFFEEELTRLETEIYDIGLTDADKSQVSQIKSQLSSCKTISCEIDQIRALQGEKQNKELQELQVRLAGELSNLEPGQKKLIPGGITSHAILYEIERITDHQGKPQFIFHLFNSGKGLEKHHEKSTNPLEYLCHKKWIIGADFFNEPLKELLKLKLGKTATPESESIDSVDCLYEIVNKAAKPVPHDPAGTPKDPCWMPQQNAGTCTFGSINVWQAAHLKPEVHRRFTLCTKINAYKQFKQENPEAITSDALIRSVASQILNSINQEQEKLKLPLLDPSLVRETKTQNLQTQQTSSEEFSAINLNTALEEAKKITSPENRDQKLSELSSTWSKISPAFALKAALEIKEFSNRDKALFELTSFLIRENPKTSFIASEAIKSIKTAAIRDKASIIFAIEPSIDISQAYRVANQITNTDIKTKALSELAQQIIQRANPTEKQKLNDESLQSLSQNLFLINPSLSYEIAKTIKDKDLRNIRLAVLAQELLLTNLDIAKQAVNAIDDESYKNDRLNYLCEKLMESNFEEAFKWTNSITDPSITLRIFNLLKEKAKTTEGIDSSLLDF